MSVSNRTRAQRFLWPATAALALFYALLSQSCGGAECLRNSDCGSHLACEKGKCTRPAPESAAPADGGVNGGDAGIDGGDAGDAGGASDAGDLEGNAGTSF